jgi:hypothetical protein
MASKQSKVLVLLMLGLGCGIFYVLEVITFLLLCIGLIHLCLHAYQRLILDLPQTYTSHNRPGNAQPGLDGEAWLKVQQAIDRERGLIADKVDKVSHDMVATRQRQSDLESRLARYVSDEHLVRGTDVTTNFQTIRMASESTEMKVLSETIRGKLTVLDLERQVAYAAAQ